MGSPELASVRVPVGVAGGAALPAAEALAAAVGAAELGASVGAAELGAAVGAAELAAAVGAGVGGGVVEGVAGACVAGAGVADTPHAAAIDAIRPPPMNFNAVRRLTL